MRNHVIARTTAVAEKADIRDVVLPARIEAAAHLDFEFLHGVRHRGNFGSQPLSEFSGQPTRRGNTQLAGIRAGAGSNIDNGIDPRESQTNRLEFGVKLRQIGFGYPTQQNVLFDGRADIIADILSRDVCQAEHLISSNITQGQVDVNRHIILLALLVHVRLIPILKTVRFGIAV